eukprot:g2866.t1
MQCHYRQSQREDQIRLGANGASPIFALAGCINFDAPANAPLFEEKRCGINETKIHVSIDSWLGSFPAAYEAMKSSFPEIAPVDLGPIGYEGEESIYVSQTVLNAAYEHSGIALEYYKSYNVSHNNVKQYFDSLGDVSKNELKLSRNFCDETEEMQPHQLTFPRHSRSEWLRGDKKSGAAGTYIANMVSSNLVSKASKVSEFVGNINFELQEQCTSCNNSLAPIFAVGVMLFVVGCVVAYYASNSKYEPRATVIFCCIGAMSIAVALMQNIGVLGTIPLRWPESTTGILNVGAIFLLDLDGIGLNCLAAGSSGGYVMTVVLFAVAICVPKVLSMTGNFMLMSFTTLASVGLIPFMCYEHPTGDFSVLKHPNILCGSGEHQSMQVVGALVMTVATLFCAYCFWGALVAPTYSGRDRLMTFYFLINRFRPDVWWFGLMLLIRSAFVSLPAVIAANEPGLLVMLMLCVQQIYFSLLLWFLPWKAPVLNLADGFISGLLVVLLASCLEERRCSLRLLRAVWDVERDPSLSSTIRTVVAFGIIGCLLLLFFVLGVLLLIDKGCGRRQHDSVVLHLQSVPKPRELFTDFQKIARDADECAFESVVSELSRYDVSQIQSSLHLLSREFEVEIGRASRIRITNASISKDHRRTNASAQEAQEASTKDSVMEPKETNQDSMNDVLLLQLCSTQGLFWPATSPSAGKRAFRDRSELRAAVLQWESPEGREQLRADAGPISTWEVSAVTNMSGLFQEMGLPEVWTMSSMFSFTRSFNQPIEHLDTSSLQQADSIFAFARKFNQPVGSWDISKVSDPASVFWNADSMSRCVTSATRSAWHLDPAALAPASPHGWYAGCPACGNRSCHHADLACVDGFCAPLSAGYVQLGFVTWECLGFLLGPGRCLLHLGHGDPFPLRSQTGAWRAFLKATCESFSCPNSAVKVMPSFPGREMSDELHLKCFPCPDGSIPDEAQWNCVSCPSGKVARSGMARCEDCGFTSRPSSTRGSCMPCDHGQYRLPQWDVCQDCHWPRLLMGQNCVWQHLPLIPIGAIALVLLLCLIWDRARRCRDGENQRRNESKTTTIKKLEEELWDETPGTTLTLEKYTKDLQAFGMKEDEVMKEIKERRKKQSERAGVSMRDLFRSLLVLCLIIFD